MAEVRVWCDAGMVGCGLEGREGVSVCVWGRGMLSHRRACFRKRVGAGERLEGQGGLLLLLCKAHYGLAAETAHMLLPAAAA